MPTNALTFLNHACFHIANDSTLLLVDPWLEGAVFHHGWTLLDNATSNAAVVRDLNTRKLNTYIWFSNEHPDHFSVSFLKKLKQDYAGKATILYQSTKDKRVLAFLKKNGFDAIECAPGAVMKLDASMDITVFPYSDGNSFCLIRSGGRTVLNVNDCALASAGACRAVKSAIAPLAPQIDFLFTQFGYANWVGNPFEPGLRRRAAADRRTRISLQMACFKPALTIPFASFVAFSSIENSYLNDYQNSAYTIRQWSSLSASTETVRFMKPRDVLDLDSATPASTVRMSQAAVDHWESLGDAPREVLPAEPQASVADVAGAFARHHAAVCANLPGLPWLLEKLGLIKPLTMYIPDIALTARFSYINGYQQVPIGTSFDISMSSPSAVFLFSNEYGFSTTFINGRFRTASPDALQRFGRFFMPQNLGRQGYGMRHPFATAGHLAGNVLGRLRASA
ncbi:MBL fold metallo-hydrolase [Massilia sp. TWP1-3-3]|uniref:MBL fold metallo-hydrolase n=1 Tax=Massilia sp. TWP1-3-3 TaxID=2804573 RepID=UPI003CEEB61C